MCEQLSYQQLAEYEDVFNIFDINHDGHISWEELGRVMRSLGQNLTDAQLQNMIHEYDTDGNGSIEFEEFKDLMTRKYLTYDEDDELVQAFQLIDRDGNGLISEEEIRFFMTNLGEALSDSDIEDMISLVDLDGDGQINLFEFIQLMKSV